MSRQSPNNQLDVTQLQGVCGASASSDPNQLFALGKAAHERCSGHLQEAKRHAAYAGIYFRACKDLIRVGDWQDWCEARGLRNSTADHYIRFAEYVLQQGRIGGMDGLDDEHAAERGISVVMDSPKAWTSLMRYTGFVSKEGQYNPERYQARKGCPETGQMEFDFGAVAAAVESIDRMPVDRLSVGQLEALERRLETALEKVRSLRGRTIDVEAEAQA